MTKFDTKQLTKSDVSKKHEWEHGKPSTRLYRPDWKIGKIIGEIKINNQFSTNFNN